MTVRATLAFLMTTLPALAEQPLSAIDWLSEGATTEVALPSPVITQEDVTESAAIADVTVTTLGAPDAGGTGLLASDATGLPKSLWQGSDPVALQATIGLLRPSSLPSLNQLTTTLLLAEARPPGSGDVAEAFFLARIDTLLDRGAIDQALALLEAAGPGPADRFQRRFDAALLAGQEDAACQELVRGKTTADYPTRVFCLARSGDWSAAALTLDVARALGQVSTDEDRLLASFLDAEFTETLPTRIGIKPSPLVFAIYDATGEPLPTGPLPLSYAYADLRPTAGWKAQIEAAERLARAGAVPGERLFGIYTERRPSASGGVWERVAAAQALDKALEASDADAANVALPKFWDQMAPVGTLSALAPALAPRLADVTLSDRAAALGFELGLLTRDYETVARSTPDDAPREVQFMAGLAQGDPAPGKATDDRARAIARAWRDDTVPPVDLMVMPGADRLGEAILKAVLMIEDGLVGNTDKLTQGLAFLRSVGLEDVARRAALESLILRPTA